MSDKDDDQPITLVGIIGFIFFLILSIGVIGFIVILSGGHCGEGEVVSEIDCVTLTEIEQAVIPVLHYFNGTVPVSRLSAVAGVETDTVRAAAYESDEFYCWVKDHQSVCELMPWTQTNTSETERGVNNR